ncbi:MAG TPA: protein-glutamate O-methyltransferase CheR [Anaeromyxobacteraceae bacterium]|nr:protein-glutamate O-methyltransferase CheR [Anaeromyxobacteraceae bacterium]
MPAAPSTPVLALLASVVEERTGIHYGPDELDIMRLKAETRATDAGFESLLDYYYFLRYDPSGAAEMDQLVDALVVNETYFFRELPPLVHLVDRVIAPRAAAGKRTRIWSAACSSGEEPLTLTMLLDDRGLLPSVELVATDISARALEKAALGRYGPRALRDPPAPGLVDKYLRREPDGGYRASRRLYDAVAWRRVNLTDPAEVARVAENGPFDAVLLRNVLIYFSDETASRVVEAISRALARGGILMVGVSESLLRLGTSLVCEEHESVFVYRNP